MSYVLHNKLWLQRVFIDCYQLLEWGENVWMEWQQTKTEENHTIKKLQKYYTFNSWDKTVLFSQESLGNIEIWGKTKVTVSEETND